MQTGAVLEPSNFGLLVDLPTNCDPVIGQTIKFFFHCHPVQVGAGFEPSNLRFVDFSNNCATSADQTIKVFAIFI